MKSWNIKSFCSSAISLVGDEDTVYIGGEQIKKGEIDSLSSMIIDLEKDSAFIEYKIFLDYYIGYKIPQIGKEFDLLKFGKDTILNIELKGKGINEHPDKLEKILKQMIRNYYYLKFTKKDIEILTYVEGDGFYRFDNSDCTCNKVSTTYVIDTISQLNIVDIHFNKLFCPSNYLASPFNKTQEFLRNQYFLTQEQEEIKKNINTSLEFCNLITLKGGAGTGKSLLLYDIAKSFPKSECYIVHVGKLNTGHFKLRMEEFNIVSVKTIDSILDKEFKYLIFDESHRLSTAQLDKILEISTQKKIILSYDERQYLHLSEDKDISVLIKEAEYQAVNYELKSKIRTNNNISSFVKCLFDIDKVARLSSSKMDNSYVSLEYFDNINEAKSYVNELTDWQVISYTCSLYNYEKIDEINALSNTNSHAVIGQEFNKVVVILNDAFSYRSNKLEAAPSYYSSIGMLYQNVTRTIEELKIIVINNPTLYKQINAMYIKLYKLV